MHKFYRLIILASAFAVRTEIHVFSCSCKVCAAQHYSIVILTYLLTCVCTAGQINLTRYSCASRPSQITQQLDNWILTLNCCLLGPPSFYFATPLAFNAPDGGVSLGQSP